MEAPTMPKDPKQNKDVPVEKHADETTTNEQIDSQEPGAERDVALPEPPRSASPFETAKRVSEDGAEYWSSRDFAKILDYKDYDNFRGVIEKAKVACINSDHNVLDHFRDVTEMVNIGSGARRNLLGVELSRYACYLIIQNANPAKGIVAQGQTYFAYQTRRQELLDQSIEDRRRVQIRTEMREHNVNLADAAKDAGVIEPKDYAIFQNHGYMGLYGGMTAKDIHTKKGLKKSQEILDHMGSTELAANLFRATQAEEKLRREGIVGKANANRAHREVGEKVRNTIRELGGTMPEDLPAVESIKSVERKLSGPGKAIGGEEPSGEEHAEK